MIDALHSFTSSFMFSPMLPLLNYEYLRSQPNNFCCLEPSSSTHLCRSSIYLLPCIVATFVRPFCVPYTTLIQFKNKVENVGQPFQGCDHSSCASAPHLSASLANKDGEVRVGSYYILPPPPISHLSWPRWLINLYIHQLVVFVSIKIYLFLRKRFLKGKILPITETTSF